MSELSDSPGAIRNGPESPFVVSVIESLLLGDENRAGRDLDAAAEATTWAAVIHRLDVVGRALVSDLGLGSETVDWDEAGSRLGWSLDPSARTATESTLSDWADGQGLAVSVDLTTEWVDARTDRERAWPAAIAVAWLVDRAGYPAQVVV